jgi:hypothetical protein
MSQISCGVNTDALTLAALAGASDDMRTAKMKRSDVCPKTARWASILKMLHVSRLFEQQRGVDTGDLSCDASGNGATGRK